LNDRSNRSNRTLFTPGPRTPVQHEPRLGAKSIYGDWKLPASTWPSLMRADPEIVHEILFAFWGSRFACPPFPYASVVTRVSCNFETLCATADSVLIRWINDVLAIWSTLSGVLPSWWMLTARYERQRNKPFPCWSWNAKT
jgi:hypothetical protein